MSIQEPPVPELARLVETLEARVFSSEQIVRGRKVEDYEGDRLE